MESKFFDKILQGLAYYIGYKTQYYWQHDITEGSIADEMCTLLNSNFRNGEIAFREIMYKSFTNEQSKTLSDIVITNKSCGFNKKNISLNNILSIIEIKKYKNGFDKIKQDIKKIGAGLQSIEKKNEIKGFVIVVSQNKTPKEFVNKNGNAHKKTFNIDNDNNVSYRIRRVAKASASFKNKEHATYVCLIEVIVK